MTARVLRLPDGRRLAYDDVGDPSGVPIVYLHGMPDSRWSRHPDDAGAAALGVRLLALDRPGYGDSDLDPGGTFGSCADDVLRLLDERAIDAGGVFGWSAGGPFALALGAQAPDRVRAVSVACALAPIEALDEPGVLDGADDRMRLLADAARSMPPAELAPTIAPLVWPDVATADATRAALLDNADKWARADLDAVPGLTEQLVSAVRHALRHGRDGMVHDLVLLLSPFGFSLGDVGAHVELWYGDRDGTATLGMGRYLAARIPDTKLVEIRDGSHFLVFARWRAILGSLADTVRGQGSRTPA